MATVSVVALAVVLLRPYPAERLDRAAVGSTQIVDRHGKLLYEARAPSGGYGRWVGLSEISPHLIAATLSAEDANFRWHPGVDPTGVARAVWLNLRAQRIAYGGSTITQQLAGLLDPQPRTLSGKLVEATHAVRLEATLSKDEILEHYLNRAYYGRLAYGVEAAARRFFGKPAAELELDEAALLAILPRAPSAYDPARFPERALRRRAHVLATLAARGVIDERAARAAADSPLSLIQPKNAPRARHLLDALPAPPSSDRAVLATTIDLELQEGLEARLREHLADLRARDVDQAAIVVVDNATGDVLAMVGSRDYEERAAAGAVNGALALRPPGSTLKPFVYALAIERGANPSTPTFDVPTAWHGFRPRNAKLDHSGLVSLRDALASSLNVPAVRAADEVGVGAIAALLGELGLASEAEPSLALALGSTPVRLVDLANAYATLARGGEHVPWKLVGPRRTPPQGARVIEPTTAFLITDILADASARRREFGVETPLELPFPAAVKTGTSKSFCDNFVVGYTPEVTVGVWVGNFDGRPMHGLLAMQGAAPLWRDAMLQAMAGRAQRDFEPPAGVLRTELCPLSGMRRGANCPVGHHEHVARAHAPERACDWHGPNAELSVPAELRSLRARSTEGLAPSPGALVEIASPMADAKLVIDPLLPRARQVLRLRALVRAPAATAVRWELDGRVLASAPAPFGADWPIEPGAHRVRAIAVADEREIAAHEVVIFVQGEPR